MARQSNRYSRIIERVFHDRFADGMSEIEFERKDLVDAANALGVAQVSNLGDLLYTFRHRQHLPDSIRKTESGDLSWIIEGAGKSRYRFKLVKLTRVLPSAGIPVIEIPDATPELIRAYALADEQALLAIIRYNRLIDVFLGLTTYSLQNHLRTTVEGIGQIEIDELYVGLDRDGIHYLIPVQAKGGNDEIGVTQIAQDIKFVETKFQGVRCRAIAAQFLSASVVVLFELEIENDELKVVDERHYELVSRDQTGE